MVLLLEVVLEPVDVLELLLDGDVRVFGQADADQLHEVPDRASLRTPRLLEKV